LKPLNEQDEYFAIDRSSAKNRHHHHRRRRHRDTTSSGAGAGAGAGADSKDGHDSKDGTGLHGPGSFINLSADDKLGSAMASRGLAYVSSNEAHQDLSLNKYLASVPPSLSVEETETADAAKSIGKRSGGGGNEPMLKGFDNSYRSLQQQHKNIAARLQPLQFITPVNSRSTNLLDQSQSQSQSLEVSSFMIPSPSPLLKQSLPPLSNAFNNDDRTTPMTSSKAPGAPISENDKGYQPRYPMWN